MARDRRSKTEFGLPVSGVRQPVLRSGRDHVIAQAFQSLGAREAEVLGEYSHVFAAMITSCQSEEFIDTFEGAVIRKLGHARLSLSEVGILFVLINPSPDIEVNAQFSGRYGDRVSEILAKAALKGLEGVSGNLEEEVYNGFLLVEEELASVPPSKMRLVLISKSNSVRYQQDISVVGPDIEPSRDTPSAQDVARAVRDIANPLEKMLTYNQNFQRVLRSWETVLHEVLGDVGGNPLVKDDPGQTLQAKKEFAQAVNWAIDRLDVAFRVSTDRNRPYRLRVTPNKSGTGSFQLVKSGGNGRFGSVTIPSKDRLSIHHFNS
jgi:hypothetical protein